ncbi:MAG: hypothetical protein AUH41_08700 [Gemmatimonadetes bacterium 13_1_40CM_66_11]|nr:MAG: hypothetical protein AUH41_08700 [Gemmatimonadetes bacterium 13_1_40CM_66_11]
MSRAAFAVMLVVLFPAPAIAQTPASTNEWPPLKVVDVRWIDTTVSACVDFSRFANGAWLAHDTIPAAYSSSGVTRDMSDRNELVVRSVLDDAAARDVHGFDGDRGGGSESDSAVALRHRFDHDADAPPAPGRQTAGARCQRRLPLLA